MGGREVALGPHARLLGGRGFPAGFAEQKNVVADAGRHFGKQTVALRKLAIRRRALRGVLAKLPIGLRASGSVLAKLPPGLRAPGSVVAKLPIGLRASGSMVAKLPIGLRASGSMVAKLPIGLRAPGSVLPKLPIRLRHRRAPAQTLDAERVAARLLSMNRLSGFVSLHPYFKVPPDKLRI